MGYGHSLDLRRRIIAAVEAVALAREAGRRFEVSASSAVNLVRRWQFCPGPDRRPKEAVFERLRGLAA